MLTNYFKIALRYVLKNRVFSLINIGNTETAKGAKGRKEM